MEQQADIIWDVPRALRTHVHPDVFVQQRRLYCIFRNLWLLKNWSKEETLKVQGKWDVL